MSRSDDALCPSHPEELLADLGWVRRLAHRALDPSAADDASQEVAVAALRHARARGAVTRPWLAGTLRNLLRMRRRGDARRARRERAAAPPAPTPPSAEVVAEAEAQRRVVAAVLRLAEPYRTTLLLRFLRELDAADVARRMGTTASTVRVRTMRGLELLRRERGLGPDPRAVLLAAALPRAGAIVPPSLVTTAVLLMSTKALLPLGALLAAVLSAVLLYRRDAPAPRPSAAAPAASREAPSRTGPGARSRVAAAPAAAPVDRVAAVGHGDAWLSGTVRGRGGARLAGAKVSLMATRIATALHEQPAAEAHTDDEGVFSFDGVKGGRTYGLVVTADGYAPWAGDRHPGPTEIVLRPAARLYGMVVAEPSGTPRDDLWIRIERPSWGDRGLDAVDNDFVSANGGYAFDLVPTETEVLLEVVREGELPVLERVVMGPGDTRHDIRVGPERTAELRVVDEQTLQPVAGAEIRCTEDRGMTIAASDGDGVARALLWREPAALGAEAELIGDDRSLLGATIAVEAPGYCPTILPLGALAGLDRVEVAVSRAAAIAGVVLTADGRPVEGATIAWADVGNRGVGVGVAGHAVPGRQSLRASTGPDGRFLMSTVPWGAIDAALEVRDDRGRRVVVPSVSPQGPGDTRELRIVLDAGRTVRGTVRVNGEPDRAYAYLKHDGTTAYDVRCDAAGGFAIDGVEPGDYQILAVTGDGTLVRSEPLPLRVGDRDPEPIELYIRAEFATIEGSVVRPDGTPVPGVEIAAIAGDHAPRWTEVVAGAGRSRADGTFTVRVRPDSGPAFALQHWVDELPLCVRGVERGATGVRFVVPETRAVTLRVTGSDGVRPAAVRIATAHGQLGELRPRLGRPLATDASGAVTVHLPVGAQTLTVEGDDPASAAPPARIVVPALGPGPELAVTLEPARRGR